MLRSRFSFGGMTLCLIAMCAVALLLPHPDAARAQTAAAPAAPVLDRAAAQALYSARCSACHNLYDPASMNYTRAEWQRTVTKMLVQYKASNEISPTEAVEIVNYLATFAPAAGSRTLNPWDTDDVDVWATAPSLTRVYTFESTDALAALMTVTSGTAGANAFWRTDTYSTTPGGVGVKASLLHPAATRFALLVDVLDSPKNVDIRVRFHILSGRISPSVGIVYGYADPQDYSVLRYDAVHGTLSALRIAGSAHTLLQATPILQPADATSQPSPAQPVSTVAPASLPAPAGPSTASAGPGWHTLRLLVNGSQIRGWIDMNKRVSIEDPSYAGGKVGLWNQGDTIALFDDWMVDIYDTPPAAPTTASPPA